MQDIRINTDKSYSSTARTVLSGDSKSLVKTFERIRSGQDLPGIIRVEDNDNEIYSNRINLAGKRQARQIGRTADLHGDSRPKGCVQEWTQ